MRGLFVPMEAELGGLERSLEKRHQRAPADGCWVKDMLYDVGETFVRDGCKNVKCKCHWDGQVSCRQEGNECKSSFSMKLEFVTGRRGSTTGVQSDTTDVMGTKWL